MKTLIVLLSILPTLAYAQTFDRDLYFGIQNDSDVTKLQDFLTDQEVYSGPITGNFFSLTLSAVKKFQSAQSISPVSGYFGPLSRGKANQILAAEGISSTGVTDESGSTMPVTTTPPQTTNDVVSSLMAQILLLQQQLNALQQQQQSLQTIQQQQTVQTQTLQTIQQNTTPTPTLSAAPTPTPTPLSPSTVLPTPTPTAVPTPTPTPTPAEAQIGSITGFPLHQIRQAVEILRKAQKMLHY